MNPKRKTIGLRVPDNAIAQALLRELGQPLMSATLLSASKMTIRSAIRTIYARRSSVTLIW